MEDVREKMQTNKATVLLLTALDEVACELSLMGVTDGCGYVMGQFCTGLFNLRGSDIDYNPVFFGYAIITPTDVR